MTISVAIGYNTGELQELIQSALANSDYTIVTTFTSGENGLQFSEFRPDLIILEDKLSDMSSYEFISRLMRDKPIPCLVLFKLGKIIVDEKYPRALEYGIVASMEISDDTTNSRLESLLKIRLNILSKLNVDKFTTQIEQINRRTSLTSEEDLNFREKIKKIREKTSALQLDEDHTELKRDRRKSFYDRVIVIGASTGGPKTLTYIISQFPANFPPVLVVQHMPQGFIKQFAIRMNTLSRMQVNFAVDGMILKQGNVYIAPGGYHMELEGTMPKTARIKISEGVKVNFVKPAVDVTLFSAARVFGRNAISVILTGMGHDGREGTRAVKKMGGKSLALNEVESVIYGMNKSVIDAGLADEILGMDGIVKSLAHMLGV